MVTLSEMTECESQLDALDNAVLRLKIGLGMQRPGFVKSVLVEEDVKNARRAFDGVERCARRYYGHTGTQEERRQREIGEQIRHILKIRPELTRGAK